MSRSNTHNPPAPILTFGIVTLLIFYAVNSTSAQGAKGNWEVLGNLSRAGSGHAAALAKNAVLVTGSREPGPVNLFDPVNSRWNNGPPLAEARDRHTATGLRSGKVLIVGGLGSDGLSQTAEIYEPAMGRWKEAGAIPARVGHTATLLKTGKVLVVGGQERGHGPFLNDSWLYDPETNKWMFAGNFEAGRSLHAATLLRDGRVLITGGRAFAHGYALMEASIYDPRSRKWDKVPHLMGVERAEHSAVVLKDGKVLIFGGIRTPGGDPGRSVKAEQLVATAELFDPRSSLFIPAGRPLRSRYGHAAVTLGSGKVFVAGGAVFRPLSSADPATTLVDIDEKASNELFDPTTARWTEALPTPGGSSGGFSLTILSEPPCGRNCGKILVVAGTNQQTRTYLYDIDTPSRVAYDAALRRGNPAIRVGLSVAGLALLAIAFWAFRRRK